MSEQQAAAAPGAQPNPKRKKALTAVKPGASAAVMAEALALVVDREAGLAHIAA